MRGNPWHKKQEDEFKEIIGMTVGRSLFLGPPGETRAAGKPILGEGVRGLSGFCSHFFWGRQYESVAGGGSAVGGSLVCTLPTGARDSMTEGGSGVGAAKEWSDQWRVDRTRGASRETPRLEGEGKESSRMWLWRMEWRRSKRRPSETARRWSSATRYPCCGTPHALQQRGVAPLVSVNPRINRRRRSRGEGSSTFSEGEVFVAIMVRDRMLLWGAEVPRPTRVEDCKHTNTRD